MSGRRIITPGANCWGTYVTDESGLLIDCRAYYRAFYQAATAAQQYILIAGWQFDSLVALLRGPDVRDGVQEVRFLPLLNQLCKRNPHLHVYILAWDFALLFLWEREWWQRQVFNDTTCDRFLSVGSANTTNRSLGFDSELNLSWEVTAWQQRALARAIRTVRVSLLAEHTGLSGSLAWSTLCRSRQLVGVLNRLANSRQFRLRHHPLRTVFDESQWLRWWKPQTPLFDPARTLTVHDVWPSVLGDER